MPWENLITPNRALASLLFVSLAIRDCGTCIAGAPEALGGARTNPFPAATVGPDLHEITCEYSAVSEKQSVDKRIPVRQAIIIV